jgi:hypothetical protein
LPLALTTILAGWATPAKTETSAPIVPQSALPDDASTPQASWPPLEATAPPVAVVPPKPATPLFVPPYANEREGRLLLDRLLPQDIPDRKGWNTDIFNAFTYLKIPYTPQFFCAALAVIEQESSFEPDPVVPGLSQAVWGEIAKKRKKYLIPSVVVSAAMLKSSSDGRSYKERINALRTKRQMNALYEEMVRAMPFGQSMFAEKNPIRDGGPMQVSVAFAESHVRAWPYPYSYKGNLRNEVFSRRGGVYFGTAILLQYPAPYSDMLYRFADFNAGRYSSRNAAFQSALGRLVKRKLSLDGDLMPYSNTRDGVASAKASETQQALFTIAGRLNMSRGEILRDLKQEKYTGFGQSELYQKVFTLADQTTGQRLPREVKPQIRLVSPKLRSTHLTTEWFANKVNGRYRTCLARGGA